MIRDKKKADVCVCECVCVCVCVCVYTHKKWEMCVNTILKAFGQGECHRNILNGEDISCTVQYGSEGNYKIFQYEPPGSSQKNPRATKRQDMSEKD